MTYSSWFPNPHRPAEAFTEDQAKRAIDTLLSYRRKEILLTFAAIWCVVLCMVFSLIVVVRAAYIVF